MHLRGIYLDTIVTFVDFLQPSTRHDARMIERDSFIQFLLSSLYQLIVINSMMTLYINFAAKLYCLTVGTLNTQ